MNTVPEINEMIENGKAMHRAKVLACKHPEVVFESGQGALRCGECDRPLRFLSDTQIEEERLSVPRVEIQKRFDGPSSCRVWFGERLVFDGVSRDAMFQPRVVAKIKSSIIVGISAEEDWDGPSIKPGTLTDEQIEWLASWLASEGLR